MTSEVIEECALVHSMKLIKIAEIMNKIAKKQDSFIQRWKNDNYKWGRDTDFPLSLEHCLEADIMSRAKVFNRNSASITFGCYCNAD